MKIAALILGILGGALGLFAGAMVSAIAGMMQSIYWGGWAAMALSLLGILGGAIVFVKPRIAGVMMVIAGVGSFIAISSFIATFVVFALSGPLLLIGGLLAFFAPKAPTTDLPPHSASGVSTR